MSTPLESTVEKFLREAVAQRGGFTIKLNAVGNRGAPDRLVVLPGRILFVEVKRPRGGRVGVLQRWWQARIRTLGHGAYIVKNEAEVLQVLDTPNPLP